MDRTKELEDEIRRLSLNIEEMRGRLGRLEGGSGAEVDGARRSRRGFLRMGAAAAAGALGWAAVRAVPAAAATGSYMVLGCANSAANPTTLSATDAFEASDPSFSSSALTAALPGTETFSGPLQGLGATAATEGVDAFAGGSTAFGVWGLTDSGTGVVGEANTGIGLHARGTGRIRQDPLGTAGTPPYTPNLMEQVRDANGILYIHRATGTAPSMWRRVNTLRTDAADGSGNPYKPFRIVDTRLTSKPAAGTTQTYTMAGQGTGQQAIPADAIAVVGNLTATAFNAAGYLSIFPGGVTNPGTSSLNFSVGQTAIANSFVCGLGSGQLQVFVGAAATHYIIDITGYIQ